MLVFAEVLEPRHLLTPIRTAQTRARAGGTFRVQSGRRLESTRRRRRFSLREGRRSAKTIRSTELHFGAPSDRLPFSEDQQVARSTCAASTWRIETAQGSPELNIGSYLPLCGEILNNADSQEKAK
jgi:hypothetical protein